MLGEEIEILSLHGRTIARVLSRSRLLQYAYEVRAEDGRTLMFERKPWDDESVSRPCSVSCNGGPRESMRTAHLWHDRPRGNWRMDKA